MFPSEGDIRASGGTAAGGSRMLWTRREFGIRILRGLTVDVGVITKLVMCSGRNFNTGEDCNI
jgi:hypothetical protein